MWVITLGARDCSCIVSVAYEFLLRTKGRRRVGLWATAKQLRCNQSPHARENHWYSGWSLRNAAIFFYSFLYFASTPKTCLSVCVKNYGRSKTMRKRWCRLIAVNEDVPRLVEVELSSVFLNTYPGLPRSSHAPLSNLLFYWLPIACAAIVSGLGLIVCFIRLI